MENMREYWAREAEMMRDKSAILGTKDNSSSSNTLSFSQNIRKSVELLDDNKVSFGLNRIRNVAKSGLFDERMWSIVNDSTLRLNQGRTPAKGIQSILNNSCSKWTLDCAQYVQVVYLGACLLTDGPTQFNKYINDLLIGKGQSNFELHSHGTVGVENKDFYTRGVFNDAFRLDTDFDSKSVGKTEADLLRLAPIGSRITVANFQAYALVGSKNTEYKKYGEGVFLSGWANENMIKIASDRYAAFGVGKNVTLKEVKEVLLQVYYQVPLIAPKNKTKEEVLALITTSQVAIFNRS